MSDKALKALIKSDVKTFCFYLTDHVKDVQGVKADRICWIYAHALMSPDYRLPTMGQLRKVLDGFEQYHDPADDFRVDPADKGKRVYRRQLPTGTRRSFIEQIELVKATPSSKAQDTLKYPRHIGGVSILPTTNRTS